MPVLKPSSSKYAAHSSSRRRHSRCCRSSRVHFPVFKRAALADWPGSPLGRVARRISATIAAGAPAAQVNGSHTAANAPLTISAGRFLSCFCMRDASPFPGSRALDEAKHCTLCSGVAMNWQHVERNWSEYKLNARTRWSRLSSSDLDRIAGNREQLLRKICEAYGMSAEEAELQLTAWGEALREVNPFR